MGGAVVPIDHAFDQRRTSLVGECDLDRFGELAAVVARKPRPFPSSALKTWISPA
jgi:hypothetical protein